MSTRSLLVSVAAAVSIGMVTAGQGSFPVSWTPSKVELSPLIGTVSTAQLSFVSRTSLGMVRAEIVPELAPYVAVVPSEFFSVPANTQLTITLVISIPTNVATAITNGTITLVDATNSRRTIARPLPIVLDIRSPSLFTIPTDFTSPSLDRIGFDGGVAYVRNEVLVAFNTGTDPAHVEHLVRGIGGTFLGSFDNRIYQIAMSQASFNDLQDVVTTIQDDPSVDFATLNLALDFFSQAEPNSFEGEEPTDAQTLINLQRAWLLVPTEKKPTLEQCQKLPWNQKGPCVAITDQLFESSHADLEHNYGRYDPALAFRAFYVGSERIKRGEIHGTAVASIAGGRAFNGHGTNGVMRDGNLLLYEMGVGIEANLFTDWIEAVSSALDDGPRIVNVSLGASCGTDGICNDREQTWLADFDKWFLDARAQAHAADLEVLWVLAAGNAGDRITNHTSPARFAPNFDDVLSVAAVNGVAPLGGIKQLVASSNTGIIAAPGTDLNAACAHPDFVSDNTNCNGQDWVSYKGEKGGTSFAAPFVTGVAGLMLSASPDLRAATLKERLLSSGNRVVVIDEGPDNQAGTKDDLRIPLLDACRAVKAAKSNTGDPVDPVAPQLQPVGSDDVVPGTLGLNGEVVYDIVFHWNPADASESCNAVEGYEFTLFLDGTPYSTQRCSTPPCRIEGATSWEDVVKGAAGTPPKLNGWEWSVRPIDKYDNPGLAARRSFSLAAVGPPPPHIVSISPAAVIGGAFDLRITGTGFDSGAIDQVFQPNGSFMGQGTIRSRSATQIVVTEFMAGAAPFSQPYIVKVKNPDGQLSNGVSLTLNNEVSVWPVMGAPGTAFTYTGRGFTGSFGVTSRLKRPDGTEFLPLQIPTVAGGMFGHVIDSTGFAPGIYEVWAEDNNTKKSSPLVTFVVDPSAPLGPTLYDNFEASAIDPSRWSPSSTEVAPGFVRVIQNGELVLKNEAPLAGRLGNHVLITQLTGLRSIQADVRLTEWEAPPPGAVNTNSARLLFALYNDGTPGGGAAGEVVANIDFGVLPGQNQVTAFVQIFRCGDPSCSSVTARQRSLGVVTDPNARHVFSIAWDGARVVRFGFDGVFQTLDPTELGAINRPSITGFTGLGVVGVSRVAAVFDNVYVGRVLAPGITVDGDPSEWAVVEPILVDLSGDGPFDGNGNYYPGSDFTRLSVSNEATNVYLLMEFAALNTGGIAVFLDTDQNAATGCNGSEYLIFVSSSEPAGRLALADCRDCAFSNDFPGAIRSEPVHGVSRFLEAAIPISTLRTLTPGMTGFRISGIATSPPPLGISDTIGPFAG